MHQPYTINQPYHQSRHRGMLKAAIQKVFAIFYHNDLKKNMPENLELPGEWKYTRCKVRWVL